MLKEWGAPSNQDNLNQWDVPSNQDRIWEL